MRLPRILVPFAAAVLAVAGCSHPATADDPGPDGRTFVSVGVDGDQIPGGGPLEVGFDADRISVFAGCNHGSGTADLADGVIVTRLATTMMACPAPLDQADGWMTALFDAHPRWTLAGDTLTLRTEATTVTLRDKKVVDPDRSLTDTDWLVVSTISTQAVTTSQALEQARPTLKITGDGAVSGFTGCNQFTGHADLAGAPDHVEFGPLAVTTKACSDEVSEVEQAVLRALTGRVQTTIDAAELRLRADDGYGLVLRAQ